MLKVRSLLVHFDQMPGEHELHELVDSGRPEGATLTVQKFSMLFIEYVLILYNYAIGEELKHSELCLKK